MINGGWRRAALRLVLHCEGNIALYEVNARHCNSRCPAQELHDLEGESAGLKPDGSGTVTALGRKGLPWDFEFEPGTGAWKIKYGSRYETCRFLLTPK